MIDAGDSKSEPPRTFTSVASSLHPASSSFPQIRLSGRLVSADELTVTWPVCICTHEDLSDFLSVDEQTVHMKSHSLLTQ